MNTQQPDMAQDIRSCQWMVQKILDSYTYAQHLYAAICNNKFQRNDVIPILKNWTWTASWRTAGGIVGEIRGGSYGDFYCSGPRYNEEEIDNVQEGTITYEIRQDLFDLGWVVTQETEYN